MNLSDIKTEHLQDDNSCFHISNLVSKNSDYLKNSLLYVSEKRELYGVSFSLFKSMIKYKIKECRVVKIPGPYDEKFDFYLHNINSNMTFLYFNIRDKYSNRHDLENSEFDDNQIDLMYSTKLEQKLDEIQVEKEILEIKRVYKITILLKTLEDNIKIQKYFHITKDRTHTKENKKQKELIIDFDYFKRIAINKKGPIEVNKLFNTEDDVNDVLTPFPSLIIDCKTIQEMDEVLEFLKINKEKHKTTRINFKKVEKCFR